MWKYRCYNDGRHPNLWRRWYDSNPKFQGSHDSIFEMLESRQNWGPPHAEFLDKENRIVEVRLTGKVKHRILGFYSDVRGEFIVLGPCIHKQGVYTPHGIRETVVDRKNESRTSKVYFGASERREFFAGALFFSGRNAYR
jgi:hypothetical protein